MIKNIIDLLNGHDFYGESKRIDIAKGINAIPYSWNQGLKSIKRIWKSKK